MGEHEKATSEHEPMTYWGWISPRPGLVAGYMQDASGAMHLYAVLQYPPLTSETMRSVRLRELDRPENLEGPAWRGPVPPPSPAEVSASWEHDTTWRDWMDMLQANPHEEAALLEKARGEVAARVALLQEDAEVHLDPAMLRRLPYDLTPDDFFRRIANAYLLLATQTTAPTKRIAELAGVTQPAATSWVHRARRRGYIPPIEIMTTGKESTDD